MVAIKKIDLLRTQMKENGISAYIIPSNDPHNSEYLPEYFKSRQWISGFTGSAGTIVVTLDDAGLWTDGRYFIQAEEQIKGSGIKLFKMRIPGVPTINEWLYDTLKKNDVVGMDGSLFSVSFVEDLEKKLNEKSIYAITDIDFIEPLWLDRPCLPHDPIFLHELKYCGVDTSEKVKLIRDEMTKNNSDYYLINTLPDIAWLLNLRGNDIHCNPFFMSFAIISKTNVALFIDCARLRDPINKYLEKQNISVFDYYEIEYQISKLNRKASVQYDPKTMNYELVSLLNESVTKIPSENIIENLKAIKNDTEIENLLECQKQDGIKMVKFMKWLQEAVPNGNVTEISAADQLQVFRSEIDKYIDISFDTIAGYKDHAAMMHYKATEDNQHTLKSEGMFLVDSGGHYYNGTTDITRTFILGSITEEEKTDYTLVLKGHIGLDRAVFLEGTTGANLDILARQDMWRLGIDYKCGTGHGVGFLGGVHEGPQGVSSTSHSVKLVPGMILTNEPGIYREGKHGIRIENTVLIKERQETEFGKFYDFKTISFCPIDKRGIDKSLLTEEEIKWLNDYHKLVYDVLSPDMDEELKAFLAEETIPL